MSILTVANVAKSYAADRLFTEITFSLAAGQKRGLIGRSSGPKTLSPSRTIGWGVNTMTMVLELTEAQKQRLQRYAARQGKNPQTVMIEWVDALPEQPESAEPLPPRIAGLFAGQLWMSEDFNDPLPDEFWFPEEKEAAHREPTGD
jgi:hypothetical protein